MMRTSLTIELLPNEVLATVLATFSTEELLRIVPINRRFSSLITRILYQRLVKTASLPENEVILECYHPSAKISTPYLNCRYLSLRTRDGVLENKDTPDLSDLRRLYSSFRPVVAEENRRRQRWFRLVPLGQDPPTEQQEIDEPAIEDVYLEEGELFSQLCSATNVVKAGPKRGLFVSHVNISDGVIRVWREWLANRASETTTAGKGDFSSSDKRILWVDTAKSVGLRFQVSMGPCERMPLMSELDSELPISYSLVYEELLVRTSKLLLAVEKSAVQEFCQSSKAIVIASM